MTLILIKAMPTSKVLFRGMYIINASVNNIMSNNNYNYIKLIKNNVVFKRISSKPKTCYISGVDFNEAYTSKDFRDKGDIEGDENLRKQVIVPKDICNALAMETDGAIWAAPQLTEGRKKMQKMSMDVHSRVVSDKAEPSECQICDCVSDKVGVGMSVCRSCEPRAPITKVLIIALCDNLTLYNVANSNVSSKN
jgi:hypothetical protein